MASSTTNQRTFPDLEGKALNRWKNEVDAIKENWGFDIATDEDPVPDLKAPGTGNHVGISALQLLKALSVKYKGCGRAVIAALRAQAEQRQGQRLTAGQRPNHWITLTDIKAALAGFGNRVFARGNFGDNAENVGQEDASSSKENASASKGTASAGKTAVVENASVPPTDPVPTNSELLAAEADRQVGVSEYAAIPDFVPVAAIDRLNYRVGQLLQTSRTLQAESSADLEAGQISARTGLSVATATQNIIEVLGSLAGDMALEGFNERDQKPTVVEQTIQIGRPATPCLETSLEEEALEMIKVEEMQGMQEEGAYDEVLALSNDVSLSYGRAT